MFGAAGLLKGRRATTHWAYTNLLPLVGAKETTAQSIQLTIEYEPTPPFDAGHPNRAPDAAKQALGGRYEKSRVAYRTSLVRLSA